MGWMASRFMCGMVIFTCLSGCAMWSKRQELPVLPPTEAPVIIMNAISSSKVISVSSSSPSPTIEILDHRPDQERHYYPGSLQPRRWQDGMSMVPMEAFDPAISEQIESHCLRTLDGKDVTAVSIEITSFQFVFDQRLKLKDESSDYARNWLDRKDEEEEEREERRRISDEQSRQRKREQRDLKRNLGMEVEDPSIASDLFSSAATGAFRWMILDAPRRSAESAHFRNLQKPLPAETPAFISRGKQEGLNCQLNAVVTVTHTGGQTQQLHPELTLHAPHDESLDLQTQIGDLVTRTLSDFANFLTN
jgi:hypothetical protein